MKRLFIIILSFFIVGCGDNGLPSDGPTPPDTSQTPDDGGDGNEGGDTDKPNDGEGGGNEGDDTDKPNDGEGGGSEGDDTDKPNDGEGGGNEGDDADKPTDDNKKPQLNPYEKWEGWIPLTKKTDTTK